MYLVNPGCPKPCQARVRRGGKEVSLGQFANAEEAALCVARAPEGQVAAAPAAAAPAGTPPSLTGEEAALCVARSPEGRKVAATLSEEEGQGTPPTMPAGAVLKQEGAVPPMPLGAVVKEEEVAPPMPPGAFFKEENVPPMPLDARIKQEHEVVVKKEGDLNDRRKMRRKK